MAKVRVWLNEKGQFVAPLAIILILLVGAYFTLQYSTASSVQASAKGAPGMAAVDGGGCGSHTAAAGGGCGSGAAMAGGGCSSGGCGSGSEAQTVKNGTPLFPEKSAKAVKTAKK